MKTFQLILLITSLIAGVIGWISKKLLDKYEKKWIERLMGIAFLLFFICGSIGSCLSGGTSGSIMMKPD